VLSMIVMLIPTHLMMNAMVGFKATNPWLYGVKKEKEGK